MTIDEIREIVFSPDALLRKTHGLILLDEIDRLTRVVERIKQAMCYEQCDEDKLIEIQRTLSED